MAARPSQVFAAAGRRFFALAAWGRFVQPASSWQVANLPHGGCVCRLLRKAHPPQQSRETAGLTLRYNTLNAPTESKPMIWMRNLLFVSLVGGGLFTVGYGLVPPRAPRPVTRYDANAYSDPQFRDTVDQVDASIREQWAAAKVRPAKLAPDLLVARRLALRLGRDGAVARRNPSDRNLAHGTTLTLVARPPLARPPLRRLLRRASGTRLRRRRGRAVHLLSSQPVYLVAGGMPRSEPAL